MVVRFQPAKRQSIVSVLLYTTSPVSRVDLLGGGFVEGAEDFLIVISKLLSQRNLIRLEVRVQFKTSMTTHILL